MSSHIGIVSNVLQSLVQALHITFAGFEKRQIDVNLRMRQSGVLPLGCYGNLSCVFLFANLFRLG